MLWALLQAYTCSQIPAPPLRQNITTDWNQAYTTPWQSLAITQKLSVHRSSQRSAQYSESVLDGGGGLVGVTINHGCHSWLWREWDTHDDYLPPRATCIIYTHYSIDYQL